MSLKPKRRKCRCCSELFLPDYRNRERQHYCGKPGCRHASKVASQRRWLRKPGNRDYFRGPKEVERVRTWRKAHPGYWKKKPAAKPSTQVTIPQQVASEIRAQSSGNAPRSSLGTLQDFCFAQDPGFIGLLSMITGRTLPDDIAATARRVVEQGRNILGRGVPEQTNQQLSLAYDLQTSAARGPAAASSPGL